MIHECKFYKGQIQDVSTRRRDGSMSIHCRSCGEELKDEEVNPKMLKLIRGYSE